jgi:hypothetical protein
MHPILCHRKSAKLDQIRLSITVGHICLEDLRAGSVRDRTRWSDPHHRDKYF